MENLNYSQYWDTVNSFLKDLPSNKVDFKKDFDNIKDYFQKQSNYSFVEKDGDYIIELLVPGYSKEDIKIKYEKDVLTISSTINTPDDYTGNWRRSFEEQFKVKDIDSESINAKLEKGILKIVLKKHISKKGREVFIN